MASVELAHADNLRTADNRMAASLGTVRAVFTVVQIIMRLVEMIILAKRNNGYYNTTQKKTLVDRFADVYRPDRHHGAKKLLAAAAHHRLMWIHPFLDGNGRVARFFTEAYLLKISIEGSGLWSISRGLARKSTAYKAALSLADEPRRNDLDGRGTLTNKGLTDFCRFFLEACLDQVDYMGSLLQLDGLIDRIQGYINLRNNNIAPGYEGASPLRVEAGRMLQEVLLHGETARGAVVRASGLKERTARNLLAQLLDEGLLLSDSAKGFVRMGFPIHATGWLFPELYPR